MQTNDNGVTFVNAVLGRGILNGIVNISFGVFKFDPFQAGVADDGSPIMQIDNTLTVAARLRMDVACLRQLHESLGSLLENIDQEQAKLTPPASSEDVAAMGKPN